MMNHHFPGHIIPKHLSKPNESVDVGFPFKNEPVGLSQKEFAVVYFVQAGKIGNGGWRHPWVDCLNYPSLTSPGKLLGNPPSEAIGCKNHDIVCAGRPLYFNALTKQ